MIKKIAGKEHLVIKRNGQTEKYNSKKLYKAILWCADNNKIIAKQVLNAIDIKIYNKIPIQKLWDTVIDTAANLTSAMYPIYDDVAKRAYLLKIYKESYNVKAISDGIYPDYLSILKKGVAAGIYRKHIFKYLSENEIEQLNKAIDIKKDSTFSFIGLVTIMEKYAFYANQSTYLELPQHVYMRAAIEPFLYDTSKNKIEKIIIRYNYLSNFIITEATPKMLSSLTDTPQMASCVLQTTDDDTIAINNTDDALALFSKYGGGLAIDISAIRCTKSFIGKLGGRSDGPIPFIQKFEGTVAAFNQRGKRKGSAVVTFPFWHYDAPNLIMLKDAGGSDDSRARKLQYAVKWYRIFTKRIEEDTDITLFDPKETPLLLNTWGNEFEKAYLMYEEKASLRKKKIKARELAFLIAKVRSETGNLYITFIDNINEQRMGEEPVFSSNLCVTGDTKVLTKKYGYIPIQKVAGQQLECWNGTKWSLTYLTKTHEFYTKIYKVIVYNKKTKKEIILKVSDYHKWYNTCGEEFKTFELTKGMVLEDYHDPLTNQNFNNIIIKNIELIQDHGESLYCGNEPEKHKLIFNGVLTGNCQEIVIPSKADKLIKQELKIDFRTNKTYKESLHEVGEIGLCNLSAINSVKWMNLSTQEKDEIMANLLEASDNLIDNQFYPVLDGEYANKQRRAIGIGLSNLAYYFAKNKVKWTDKKAEKIQQNLLEDISFFVLKHSAFLAKERGTYSTYKDSNWAKGYLPIDFRKKDFVTNLKYDWQYIKDLIKNYGVRFSYHMAIPPTATSGQIIQATEGCEPIKNLFEMKEGTYTLPVIVPELIKYRNDYQSAFNIPNKTINKLASIRQIFLDQTQSVSHYYKITNSAAEIIVDIIHAEQLGMKTLYYLQPMKSEVQEYCESCSA